MRPNPRAAAPFRRFMTGIQTKPDVGGLRIRHVGEGSPAAKAGLAAGDLITAIDGAPARNPVLMEAKAGQTLSIQRAGGPPVTLAAARYY